jgi:hypothetical protein
MNLISASALLSVLISWLARRRWQMSQKWCQSSGLFSNWGWMGGSQWETQEVDPQDGRSGPRSYGSTQRCPIRLPHANLLRFHTILNIYYHRNKIVIFLIKKL